MKPQAYEALQKAKALFRHPAEVLQDDIPEEVKSAFPDGIRKPKVVLIPTNAPKFDAKTLDEEHKKMEKQKQSLSEAVSKQKQIDKYVEMSVTEACEACIKMGITKPSAIAKETGKKVEQIYTSMWHLRKRKVKAKQEARAKAVAKKGEWNEKQMPTPKQQADYWNNIKPLSDDFSREPTAWEDAHHVVFKSRAEYEKEIERLNQRITDLLIEKQEQSVIIKYFERKLHV